MASKPGPGAFLVLAAAGRAGDADAAEQGAAGLDHQAPGTMATCGNRPARIHLADLIDFERSLVAARKLSAV